MFRFYNELSPPLMNSILNLRAENRYNLKHVTEFSRSIVKSVYYGTEITSYLAPKIWDKYWDILPETLSNIYSEYRVTNLEYFEEKIKTRKGYVKFTLKA